MGRVLSIALTLLGFLFLSPTTSVAQRPHAALRIAEDLLSDTCELHRLLESRRADASTFRSACRLESTVEALIEKLQCAHDEVALAELMDECALWYSRTSVGIRRDCRLDEDRAIASVMACAGRNLNLLEDAITCLIRDSRRRPSVHPDHRHGNVGEPNWNGRRFGGAPLPLPGEGGSWVSGPIGEQRFSNSPFGSPGFDQHGLNTDTRWRGQPGVVPGAFPGTVPSRIPAQGPALAPAPFSSRPPQARGNQGLGMSVLESVLSELARSR